MTTAREAAGGEIMETPMGEDPVFAKAHQAIGAYICAFSALQRELGEAVKVVLGLQTHPAGDFVVAALQDPARKASLVGAAVRVAKNVDGSETSDKWKAKADKTMSAVFECNNGRVQLAHAYLEPHDDGSVELTKENLSRGELKGGTVTWKDTDLENKIKRLREVTAELRTIKDDLSTLIISIPNMGWLVQDAYQPMRRGLRVPWEDTADTPLPLRDEAAKREP
jgi:hypothetical protein